MPLRPALAARELARIRARYQPLPSRARCTYPDDEVWPDIVALLYEIKRLRAMLLRVEQLRAHFPNPGGCLADVWEEFMRALAQEPCVLERRSWKGELVKPASNRKVRPQPNTAPSSDNAQGTATRD